MNVSESSANLIDWADLGTDYKIVHSLELNRHFNSSLLSSSADELIAKWDVFSASLISMNRLEEGSWHTTRNGNKIRETGAFGDINFVLHVPPQNIIGTHSTDINVDTHAGKDLRTGVVRDSFALCDGIFGGINRSGKKTSNSFNNTIIRPSLLLKSTSTYNEILIVGRKGLNIHAGLRPTGEVRVESIVVAPKIIVGHPDLKDMADELMSRAVDDLSQQNPTVGIMRM